MEKIIKDILNKENLKYKHIQKSDSGFSNIVFLIDKSYVIKICSGESKIKRLNNEINFYKNITLEFIPKYITDGTIGEFRYLVIEYLSGSTLYKLWHKLTDLEREKTVKQIAQILSQFHKQEFNYLPKKKISLNWVEKWQNSFALNINELQKRNFDTTKIEYFVDNHLQRIFNEQKLGLVYNDAHFDNFIYSYGKLKLIDFDRIMYGSIDYELLIISYMVDNPIKFASEEDEKNVKIEEFSNVLNQLQKYYPQLFDFKYLKERVFIYRFIYNLGNAYEYSKNEWIKKELSNFEKFFNL